MASRAWTLQGHYGRTAKKPIRKSHERSKEMPTLTDQQFLQIMARMPSVLRSVEKLKEDIEAHKEKP